MNIEVDGARLAQRPLGLLLRKKLQRDELVPGEDIGVLEDACAGTREFKPGQEFVSAGDRISSASFLLKGWAASCRTLADGARQIISLYIPGDFVDLHGFLLRKIDHGVVALTPCQTACVPYDRLRNALKDRPRLLHLLWRITLSEAASHRARIVVMGRMSALSRMAQLFCELYLRLEAVELASDFEFRFPLSQPVVADALGLSVVHVSRTLRQLRSRELVTWKSGLIKILNWKGLLALAQFDPGYLLVETEELTGQGE